MQVWEYYHIDCSFTAAIVQVVVVWLTTHYKHCGSAVSALLNAEETIESCVNVAEWKSTRSKVLNAQWKRDIEIHRHHKRLQKVSVPWQSTYNCKHCDYMRYLSAPTDLSWRCCRPFGGVTATQFRVLLRVYQNADLTAATLCLLKERADAWHFTMFYHRDKWTCSCVVTAQ